MSCKSIDFEGEKFAIKVIAEGAYVDDKVGDGKIYCVKATTIRLNHVAHNAWNQSEVFNVRECYRHDEEWEAHKAEYEKRRKEIQSKIRGALGIGLEENGVTIAKVQTEVFAVVHIYEIGKENTTNVQRI